MFFEVSDCCHWMMFLFDFIGCHCCYWTLLPLSHLIVVTVLDFIVVAACHWMLLLLLDVTVVFVVAGCYCIYTAKCSFVPKNVRSKTFALFWDSSRFLPQFST